MCIMLACLLAVGTFGQSKKKPTQIDSLQPSDVVMLRKDLNLAIDKAKLRAHELNNAAVEQAQQDQFFSAIQQFKKAGFLQPNNDTIQANAAAAALANGRFEDAEAILNRLPFDFKNLTANLGACAAMRGDTALAVQFFEVSNASNSIVAYNKSLIEYKKGNLDNALQLVEQAILKQKGTNPAFHTLKGDILFAEKHYDWAENQYKKANRKGGRMEIQLGNAALATHNYDRAVALFQQYLDDGNRTYQFSAYYGLGAAYYRQKDYSNALYHFRKAVWLNPKSSPAHTGLANVYCNQYDNRNARKAYEKAVELDSTNVYARLGLGVILYRANEYERALVCFDYAEILFNPKNREHADFYISKGFCLLYTNQVKAAEPYLLTGRKLAPDRPDGYAGLSEFYRLQDHFLTAFRFVDKALEFDDRNDKLFSNRGSIYLKFKDYENARMDFYDAKNLNPRNINAANGYGLALLEMDEIERAMSLYDSLLAKVNNRSTIHNNRGIVHAYMALKAEMLHQDHPAKERYFYKSLIDFENAMKADTAKKFYHVNVGNVYKSKGEKENAIVNYEAYLSKNSINNLGILFAKPDQKRYSNHYLDVAVKLDSANPVYLYNRAKLFAEHFKDSLARNRDLQRALKLRPDSDVSFKYSQDGFVTIYLVDFEFDRYHYPGKHFFPVQVLPVETNVFLPIIDWIKIPIPKNKDVLVKVDRQKSAPQLKFRGASRRSRGSMHCPTF